MTDTIDTQSLSSDRPLIDPKRDRLGYAALAKYLAESIIKRTPTDSLVIAIFGPWGTGKSTLLNFVYHQIRENIARGEIIHIPFNPWWFSTHEDLIRRFFDTLT